MRVTMPCSEVKGGRCRKISDGAQAGEAHRRIRAAAEDPVSRIPEGRAATYCIKTYREAHMIDALIDIIALLTLVSAGCLILVRVFG